MKATQKDKVKASKGIHSNKALGGVGRFTSLSKAVSALTQALDSQGFTLGMVSGDLLLGEHGSRCLEYGPNNNNNGGDFQPFENSRICFTWENMLPESSFPDKLFEVVCYPT